MSKKSALLSWRLKRTVHDDVDEQDLHRVQGIAHTQNGGERDERKSRYRRAELERKEVLNVMEDGLAWDTRW